MGLICLGSFGRGMGQTNGSDKWVGKYQHVDDSTFADPDSITIDIKKSGKGLIYTSNEKHKSVNLVFSGYCKTMKYSFQLFFSKIERGKLEYKVNNKSKPFYELSVFGDDEYLCQRLQPDIAEIVTIFKKVE